MTKKYWNRVLNLLHKSKFPMARYLNRWSTCKGNDPFIVTRVQLCVMPQRILALKLEEKEHKFQFWSKFLMRPLGIYKGTDVKKRGTAGTHLSVLPLPVWCEWLFVTMNWIWESSLGTFFSAFECEMRTLTTKLGANLDSRRSFFRNQFL